MPRDQGRVKPAGCRFHLCDGFSKGPKPDRRPSRLFQSLLSQTIMQPEQALGSSDAPGGGGQQERARLGQGLACLIQREQVKRGVRVCFGKTNSRAKVAQKRPRVVMREASTPPPSRAMRRRDDGARLLSRR